MMSYVYKPGDRVQVVDHWPANRAACQNPEGLMDRYLGAVVTIDGLFDHYNPDPRYIIKEDNHKWCWNNACFKGLAVEVGEAEFLNMLT